jgi:hypothetical protein
MAKSLFQVHGIDAAPSGAASAVEAPVPLGILPETVASLAGWEHGRTIPVSDIQQLSRPVVLAWEHDTVQA